MPASNAYATKEPTRGEIDALQGATLLEFGAAWCGWCRAAQPLIARVLDDFPNVRHIKISDGSGRPLGRTFGVKLWPTLIVLVDGHEVARLVRPGSDDVIRDALAQAAAPAGSA